MSPRRPVSLLLLFCLLAGTVLQSRASMELRCQCINLHSGKIHGKLLSQLTVYPAGPHCAKVEVIATTIKGREICLNPEAPRVKLAIQKILGENNESYHL
uniref:Uncharacterized protein n=2 Tax=Sphaerodactylus townsendi TaxID=933632 RepID=A0ACB8EUS9_9SAUR